VAGVRHTPEVARSRAAAALGVVRTRAEDRSRVVVGSRPGWGYPGTGRVGCQGAPEVGSLPLLPRRWGVFQACAFENLARIRPRR
jgi:hypothetical protein